MFYLWGISLLQRTTHNSITLQLVEPEETNGRIEMYHVYLNGSEVRLAFELTGLVALVI